MTAAGDGDVAARVARLVTADGTLFSTEAGIDLDGSAASWWQLLVMAQLLGARIASSSALATARELWRCGWTTPQAMAASGSRQRVAALGRGGYRRYDESTAVRLAANAATARNRYDGDLGRLLDEAAGSAAAASRLLQQFDGIGPVGAGIFLREAQHVHTDLRPVVDALVLKGATKAGLPADAAELGRLAGDDIARLCAALVRVARRR